MIFDFLSGEASTQEGGEKFAKWLAEDADLTQKKRSPLSKRSRTSLQSCWTAPRNTQCVTNTPRRFWTRCGVWRSRCPMSKRQRRPTTTTSTAMACFFCILQQKVLQRQKLSVFSYFLCKRKFGFTKPKIKSKIKKDSRKAVLMVEVSRVNPNNYLIHQKLWFLYVLCN